MSQNKVDLSSVNKATASTSKKSKQKKLFKHRSGPARDAQGRFIKGTGGLLFLKKFNWKRALPIILVVGLAGGFLVYRSFASNDVLFVIPGSNEGKADCVAAGGSVVRESSGSKRNGSVCQLSSSKTLQPVILQGRGPITTNQAQYNNAIKKLTKTGYFKVCYNIRKLTSNNATVTVGGYAVGSRPQAGTRLTVANSDYDTNKPLCDPAPHKAGETRLFLAVNSGTVRVSSIGLTPTKAPDQPPVNNEGLWISRSEIMALPASGTAWEAVRSTAYGDWGSIDLSDNNNRHDVNTLAGALVSVRLDDNALKQKTRDAIMSTTTTTKYARALEASRNLTSYVIAADIVGLSSSDDAKFRQYIDQVRFKDLQGHSGADNIHETALFSANNWGGMARAASTAISLYLNDTPRVNELVTAQRAFLGEDVSSRMKYSDTNWHATSDKAGINRRGATISGRNVDGVIPEDQRRTDEFSWPAPKGDYPWEALQGTIVTSVLLDRADKLNFRAGDDAIVRAMNWLYNVNNNPASGDDEWQPWLVNDVAGTDYPTKTPASSGKNMGWTDWTHQ